MGSFAYQARRRRCRLCGGKRHVNLLPRSRRRPDGADRRSAGRDVRHKSELAWRGRAIYGEAAMLLFLVRRIATALSVIVVTLVATFCLFYLAPTDPAGT